MKLTKAQKAQMNKEVEALVQKVDKDLGLYEYFWVYRFDLAKKRKVEPVNLEDLYAKRKAKWAELKIAYNPENGFHYTA